MNMRDDIKRVVEEVLEQKKLVLVTEGQLRRKFPFIENILGKLLLGNSKCHHI